MSLDVEKLEFNTLLILALSEWPVEIELKLLRTNIGTINERYSVKGLGNIEDSLSEVYFGKPNEVLLVNLHASISETLHALALFCKKIELDNLRGEEIQKRFERRLSNALSDSNLGWRPIDKELINKYFELNKKE